MIDPGRQIGARKRPAHRSKVSREFKRWEVLHS